MSAENRHGMSQESQAVTTRMMEEGKHISSIKPRYLNILAVNDSCIKCSLYKFQVYKIIYFAVCESYENAYKIYF